MGNTVSELQELRDALVERRVHDAYLVASAHNDERLEKLVRVHLAIEALDAVIAEGASKPESGDPLAMIV